MVEIAEVSENELQPFRSFVLMFPSSVGSISMLRFLLLLVCGVLLSYGQSLDDVPTVAELGPGAKSPHVVRRVDPQYSFAARENQVQGTVFLELIIDEKGIPGRITVVSPLGFGLDESAVAAIAKWTFTPAEKDGRPTPVRVTIEINFSSRDAKFDAKLEKQRTAFNIAIEKIRNGEAKSEQASLEKIEQLAKENYSPALYSVGIWKIRGQHLPQDLAEGWRLIGQAANKKYGPALYSVANQKLEQNPSEEEKQGAWRMLTEAATRGSTEAQLALGSRYAAGKEVQQDGDRAQQYFRLCAVRGVAQCQYRLAKLILEAGNHSGQNYLQGVAWTELAAEQGLVPARELASQEEAKLTPAQLKATANWKTQLKRK